MLVPRGQSAVRGKDYRLSSPRMPAGRWKARPLFRSWVGSGMSILEQIGAAGSPRPDSKRGTVSTSEQIGDGGIILPIALWIMGRRPITSASRAVASV